MKKWIFALVAVSVVLGGGIAWSVLPAQEKAEPVATQPAPEEKITQPLVPANLPDALKIKPTDVVWGNPDAPVQIVEYASLTCPHCATLHTQVLPQIKENFVETGKVKFVYRHLPWDNLAMAAAKISSCAAPEQYENFVGVFMRTQRQWVTAEDPLAAMKQLVRLGGMSGEQVDACLADETLHARLMANKEEAINVLNVKGTPMLFVNAQRVEGAQRYDVIEKVIHQELAR